LKKIKIDKNRSSVIKKKKKTRKTMAKKDYSNWTKEELIRQIKQPEKPRTIIWAGKDGEVAGMYKAIFIWVMMISLLLSSCMKRDITTLIEEIKPAVVTIITFGPQERTFMNGSYWWMNYELPGRVTKRTSENSARPINFDSTKSRTLKKDILKI